VESDEQLLRRGCDGDADAFRALFERHGASVRAHVHRELPAYLRRRLSVADLVQEVWATAVERSAEFEDRGEGAFRAWLRGITRLKLREMLRHHVGVAKRAVGREVTAGQRPDTALHAGRRTSPSQHAIAAETAARARAVLALLPADYREVLRLVREENLSLEEVGTRMGRSRGAAKKLFARAALRFARLFKTDQETHHGRR